MVFARKEIEWDIHKANIDAQGVQDFFWPFAVNEIMDFNIQLLNDTARVCQKHARGKAVYNSELVPYFSILKYFLTESTHIFRALLLKKRREEAGLFPDIPDYWLYTKDVWREQGMETARVLDPLACPVSVPSIWSRLCHPKNALRLIKKFNPQRGGLDIDGLKILPLTPERLRESIITTERTSLIVHHAKSIAQEVIFSRSARWFSPIESHNFVPTAAQIELEEDILDVLHTVCLKWDISFRSDLKDYIRDILHKGAGLLNVHYKRLNENPDGLPSHIWTGTGGNVWDLLLRLAVMAQGGRAQGHDHGTPAGLMQAPTVPFIELWGCTQFVTYSERHAQFLQKMTQKMPTLHQSAPEIISVSQTPPFPSSTEEVEEKIKTIMLISTIYDRDRGRLGEVPAELVKVDLQARVIAQLKAWGYDVIFKAHPESPSLPPKAFESLGAKIETRPFHEVAGDADLFLFDFVYTSTFYEALQTTIPIVVLDTESLSWEPTIRPALEKRISLVSGFYDEKNRAHVNSQDLQIALEEALSKRLDTSFYKEFYDL